MAFAGAVVVIVPALAVTFLFFVFFAPKVIVHIGICSTAPAILYRFIFANAVFGSKKFRINDLYDFNIF